MGNENIKYWIICEGLRKGPFSLPELKEMHLGPDTPVWREGLQNWVALKDLEELADNPPVEIPVIPMQVNGNNFRKSFHASSQYSGDRKGEIPPMPSTYLVWSIVTMLLCCLIPGIVALIYSLKVSSRYSAGDYEGAEKASEMASMWVMVTIVCGLIALPFQALVSMLS